VGHLDLAGLRPIYILLSEPACQMVENGTECPTKHNCNSTQNYSLSNCTVFIQHHTTCLPEHNATSNPTHFIVWQNQTLHCCFVFMQLNTNN